MGRRLKSAGTTLVISILLCGCGTTLGPRVETRYVVVRPGVPVVVVENVSVWCRVLTDSTGDAVSQDVGGWVAMPPAHWDQVKRDLVEFRDRIKELESSNASNR